MFERFRAFCQFPRGGGGGAGVGGGVPTSEYQTKASAVFGVGLHNRNRKLFTDAYFKMYKLIHDRE